VSGKGRVPLTKSTMGDVEDVKPLLESDGEGSREGDSMELPTSVTIVEEDGSTSIVEDAAVSSILADAGPNSSIQFGTQGGNLTYRVVGLEEPTATTYTTTAGTGAVQLLSTPLNGQYYVIGAPQDVLGRQRTPQIIDARSLSRVSPKSIVRDEKKRATHNEVERRRRDKINGWINRLAKIVPTCLEESTSTKAGQSKGGILAKACDYITELRSTNIRLASTLREHENAAEQLATLRRENSELRRENQALKQQLGATEEDEEAVIITSDILRSH